MASVLHIGLPLEPPWLPADECEKVAARLTGIQARMEAAGYRYVVVQASPDSGLEDFRGLLRKDPCDVVIIGGGVVSDPDMRDFKQQIVDAAREEAPEAKVVEFSHAVDMHVLVGRALGVL